MAKPHVLVVDDRENMLHLLAKVLRKDATIHTARSGQEALSVLEARSVSVIVCDLRMPDRSGLDVLRAAKRLRPTAEFILMTAYASVPTAIEAMREGAYDYITKPFNPEDLRAVVLRALGRATVTPPDTAWGSPEAAEVLPGVLGRAPVMRQLAAQVHRVAPSNAPVLIVGERGTGKERVARAIHLLSARARERLVTAHCAAIPVEILEGEVFGCAAGALLNTSRDRPGLFEEAHLGTLFLDEVGELRPSFQAKLGRAIEERAVRRVGETKDRVADVRLIAATHRDLEAMVRAGTFREGLWSRLNVAPVRVPPLRERKEDIELLALHFLRERAALTPKERSPTVTEEALAALRRFDWPGNVRQLGSVIEHASIEAGRDAVDVHHLPPEVTSGGGPILPKSIASMKWQEAVEFGRTEAARQYLTAVVQRHGGRISEAAAHAGVERESFYRLLRKYGVQPDGSFGAQKG